MPDGNAVSAVWPRKPDRDRGARRRWNRGRANLVLRIIAALVLAPAAVAIAYSAAGCGPPGDAGRDRPLCRMADDRWRGARAARGRVGHCGAGDVGTFLAAGRIDASLVALFSVSLPLRCSRGAAPLVARRDLSMPPRRTGFGAWCRFDQTHGFVALDPDPAGGVGADIGGFSQAAASARPKLWPRVGPKETWAGAFGGFTASMVVSGGLAFDLGEAGPLLLIGAMLSVASQLGDLIEVAVTALRRQGPVASSRSWRADGSSRRVRAAVVLAAIFGLLRGGADHVGRGLIVWWSIGAVPSVTNRPRHQWSRRDRPLGATGSMATARWIAQGRARPLPGRALTADTDVRRRRSWRRSWRAVCGGRRSPTASPS